MPCSANRKKGKRNCFWGSNCCRGFADPDFAAPAALVQGSSFHDIDLTDQVYKSVEKNGLSPTDVEIASLNGHVVLRGNVTTQALRDRFGSIAVTVAGTANVDNQLVVQTAK